MIENEAPIYGEGFAAVYTTSRYAVFSQRLARLALKLIAEHTAPGRQLLDLACGAGAGSMVLAAAAFEVSGIDASQVMLERAQAAADKRGVVLQLSRQDMRDFTLPYQVDIVTCLFDALNYVLTEEELGRVFAAVTRALRPDGLFVFDMNTLHGLATRWGTKDVVATNRADIFEVNQNRFDAATGINTTTTTVFVREGSGECFRRFTEVHRERGYPIPTIVRLLGEASLEPLSLHELADSYEGLAGGLRPLSDEAGRVVIVARHRG